MENTNAIHPAREFRDELCFIRLRSDGLLEVNITADKEYDKKSVLRVMVNIKKVTRSCKCRMLIICSRDSNISFDALTIINTPFSADHAIAKAFILNSISQRIMIGVFMRLFKSSFPTALFRTIQDAERWLKVQ